MGLPTDILRFFNHQNALIVNDKVVPYSVGDFKRQNPQHPVSDIRNICQKFTNESLLIHTGIKDHPFTGDTYYNLSFSEHWASYGVYDFIIYGFLSIRNHFYSSVRPVVVQNSNGDHDIGTCFVIGGNFVVTAFHCIESMKSIQIPDLSGSPVRTKKIWTSSDKSDIAVIELEKNYFSATPAFQFNHGEILDNVLTMGYPPISGFDAIQFAEIATVNSNLKSSSGSIVGQDTSYLDGQDYMLINARVKGGNSGAPIINKRGAVVGMLVNIPTNPKDARQLDTLGYGVAIPSKALQQLFQDINQKDAKVQEVKFENLEVGFKTFIE